MPTRYFDRAEYRSNVADTFVEILCLHPAMAYHIMDDVFVLGRQPKTANRSFAYEIANRLLRKFRTFSLHCYMILIGCLLQHSKSCPTRRRQLKVLLLAKRH